MYVKWRAAVDTVLFSFPVTDVVLSMDYVMHVLKAEQTTHAIHIQLQAKWLNLKLFTDQLIVIFDSTNQKLIVFDYLELPIKDPL